MSMISMVQLEKLIRKLKETLLEVGYLDYPFINELYGSFYWAFAKIMNTSDH